VIRRGGLDFGVRMPIMLGRPQTSEAGAYYFRYINQVTGDDALKIMDAQLDDALALFAEISEEYSLRRYLPEKWSIRQVLNHVNDSERTFAFRALWFARGFDTPLPSYEQDIAAASAQADAIAWQEHVDEFRCVRLASIALFRNLPPEAWERSGIASDNRFTVRALAYIIAGHLAHHVHIMRERYL
jgi:DinB superfamily